MDSAVERFIQAASILKSIKEDADRAEQLLTSPSYERRAMAMLSDELDIIYKNLIHHIGESVELRRCRLLDTCMADQLTTVVATETKMSSFYCTEYNEWRSKCSSQCDGCERAELTIHPTT